MDDRARVEQLKQAVREALRARRVRNKTLLVLLLDAVDVLDNLVAALDANDEIMQRFFAKPIVKVDPHVMHRLIGEGAEEEAPRDIGQYM